MKYTIQHLNCGKASKSWIIEIEARFPTKRQSTWESKKWTSEGIYLSQNLIWSIITFWRMVRREIKTLQKDN